MSPVNGQVVYENSFSSIATYTCDTGYGLSGGDTTRTCGGDGSSTNGAWDGMMPTCEGKNKQIYNTFFC